MNNNANNIQLNDDQIQALMKKFRCKSDLYKYLDRVVVSLLIWYIICFYFVVNLSSQRKIMSPVFLALNSFKLETTFNEEFSEDIKNS